MNQSHHKSGEYNPEKALANHMIEQYYNYISLLKITNNFEKKMLLYQNINLDHFQGKIAIIGNTTEMSHPKQQLRQKYCFPVLQTTIKKSPFIINDDSKKAAMPIKRILAVTKKNYHQIFLLPFNKVIAQSKKQKNQVFIFTGLKMYFYQEQLYFFLTKDSSIIQLQTQFYQSVFKFIQSSLECKFAELDLRKFFSQKQLMSEHTFSIQQVRNKIYQNFNEASILGILNQINRESYKKRINQKEKQVQLTIHQDIFVQQYTSYGACKIYVRFDMIDQDLILDYLKEGKIYIFKISDIIIGQNFQIYFKINRWKDNIIKVANYSAQNNKIQQKMQNITPIPLKALTHPVICRNYYKFHVTQVDLKFFHLKISCQHCDNNLVKVGSDTYQCINQCGVVSGALKLWVIVGCMDNSFYCEATIQNQNVLQFFDVQQQAQRIKQQLLNAEQIRRGVTLYFKRERQEQDEQYDDAIVYQKHVYLMQLLARCLLNISDKYIVGVPRASLFQNRNNEDQDDIKLQYIISFAKAKELNKKLDMFLNGQIRPAQQKVRFVPQIKVHRVYPYKRTNRK